MNEPASLTSDDLLDILMDLQHDLGKYIRLPLAMLPADPSADQLKDALEQALLRTREANGKAHPAREIWQAFLDESEGQWNRFSAYQKLVDSVKRALGWERFLSGRLKAESLQDILRDMQGVQEAIRDLIEEVKSEA